MPYRVKDKVYIAALYNYLGKENKKPTLYLYNIKGQKLKERVLKEDKKGRYNIVTINSEKKDELYLTDKDGKIKKLNENLETIKNVNVELVRRPKYMLDVDNDNKKELLFWGNDPEKLIIEKNYYSNIIFETTPNFKHFYKNIISVKLNGDTPPHLSIQQGDKWFLLHCMKNFLYYLKYLIYLSIYIGVFLFIYLVQKINAYRLEQKNKKLEETVKLRTAETNQQKEEIQAINEEIKNQNKLLEETNVKILDQKNKIEQSNIEITASIHYARRIQDSILPPDDFIKKILPDYFIFYRPKDIISGDFYLIDKIDKLIHIAAVDCTGHGVPGAFISIVGHNILNDALKEHKFVKPADILNDLNKGISEVFRKNYKETSVHDGMDIMYCNINPENLVLQYAGAYNPAYIVRNKQLIELNTDRFPIGSYFEDSQRKYSNNEFQLQKNDFLYLFTDGFSDQFGGPKEKKFKYKQFKELLINISHLKPPEQLEQLQLSFESWKGNLEQIDDILVMGIRI